jgi:hypothetical protein
MATRLTAARPTKFICHRTFRQVTSGRSCYTTARLGRCSKPTRNSRSLVVRRKASSTTRIVPNCDFPTIVAGSIYFGRTSSTPEKSPWPRLVDRSILRFWSRRGPSKMLVAVGIIAAMIAFIVVVVGSGIGRAVVAVLTLMLSLVVTPATAPDQEGEW